MINITIKNPLRKLYSSSKFVIILATFFTAAYNYAFCKNLIQSYKSIDISFFISIVFVVFALNLALLTLINFKQSIKPAACILILLSSLASYFMNSYNIVLDQSMLDNIMNTNINESLDLINLKLLIYLIFLGIIPCYIVYLTNIEFYGFKTTIIKNLQLFLLALTIIITQLALFAKADASFFREHKLVRSYANPAYYIYSSIKYTKKQLTKPKNNELKLIGTDATRIEDNSRQLLILVVGETARADHFSLNGYNKKTNPLLEKENIYSFNNTYSCGTSTQISVPCMFSQLERSNYSEDKANSQQNLLDILSTANVNLMWRDNNSDSKHTADRITYVDFKSPATNPICDTECRDEGMLTGLQQYINSKKSGDILIVLHQMGNHGPAYYKRYPKEFTAFTPTCQTNDLNECSIGSINNTYDNAILYTDYFLTKIISLLKNNENKFKTTMFYISDHGESLGEYNLYLHGLPYNLAPVQQKHVANIIWLGNKHLPDYDQSKLSSSLSNKYTHDNLFHTILGLMKIKTDAYNDKLDMLKDSRIKKPDNI